MRVQSKKSSSITNHENVSKKIKKEINSKFFNFTKHDSFDLVIILLTLIKKTNRVTKDRFLCILPSLLLYNSNLQHNIIIKCLDFLSLATIANAFINNKMI